MVNFGKSDKMRKINGKADKPKTDNRFSNDISSLFWKDFLTLRKIFLKYKQFDFGYRGVGFQSSMYLPNSSATSRIRYKVNFKWSKAGLNSEFFFY